MKRQSFVRAGVVAAVILGCLAPSIAAGQLVTLGSGSTSGSALAYDPDHDAYLLLTAPSLGQFVTAEGVAAGPQFPIGTGLTSGLVRAAYSADLDDGLGGSGAFLVVWAGKSGSGSLSPAFVYARVVAYPGRLVGAQTLLLFTSLLRADFGGLGISYSPVDRAFLAAWSIRTLHLNFLAPPDAYVRLSFVRLDLSARQLAPEAALIDNIECPASTTFSCGAVDVAWNPAANEFGVLYDAASIDLARVRPDGRIMGRTTLATDTSRHALAVNASGGTFLAAISGTEIRAVEIDAAGNVLTSPAPPLATGAANPGLALSYSSTTNSFLLDTAGLLQQLDEHGVATGLSLDTGPWSILAVASSSRAAEWLVTFRSGFLGIGLGPRTVERGDFTGDGYQDLVLQNPDGGAVELWEMEGSVYTGSTAMSPGGTLWQIVGSADFTGDGKPDLLWQHPDTRALLLWTMDGSTYVRSTMLSPGGTDWRVVAVGDFTGHGGPDIIWQHPANGAVLLWKMYGSAYISSTIVSPGGTYWQVVGSGDFTGDGQTDLLWQDPANGALLLWGMNGPSYVSSTILSPGGTYWKVVAVGDYTGDGQLDIVWQLPSSGALLLWEMNGIDYVSSTMINAGGTLWKVAAPR